MPTKKAHYSIATKSPQGESHTWHARNTPPHRVALHNTLTHHPARTRVATISYETQPAICRRPYNAKQKFHQVGKPYLKYQLESHRTRRCIEHDQNTGQPYGGLHGGIYTHTHIHTYTHNTRAIPRGANNTHQTQQTKPRSQVTTRQF